MDKMCKYSTVERYKCFFKREDVRFVSVEF
jgi:hypothetical protein